VLDEQGTLHGVEAVIDKDLVYGSAGTRVAAAATP
jgi:carbamate kinase